MLNDVTQSTDTFGQCISVWSKVYKVNVRNASHLEVNMILLVGHFRFEGGGVRGNAVVVLLVVWSSLVLFFLSSLTS